MERKRKKKRLPAVAEETVPLKIWQKRKTLKLRELEAATREAITQLGMDSTIDHVTDFVQIATYGVMTTPALVVDGKVVSYGKVLKAEEVMTILQKVRG